MLIVGGALLVVTVVALNHPKGRQVANATSPSTASSTASSSPGRATPGSTSKATSAPASTPAGSATSTPSNTPSTAGAGSGKLPLIVLNNASTTPASVAAQRFQAGGWTVSDTSTFSGDILNTAVYYDPNTPGAEAAATALQQQFPVIKRVKPKFDGLPAGPLVVILDSDYS